MAPSKNRVEAVTRGKVTFQGPDFHLVQEIVRKPMCLLAQPSTKENHSMQIDQTPSCGYLTQPPTK